VREQPAQCHRAGAGVSGQLGPGGPFGVRRPARHQLRADVPGAERRGQIVGLSLGDLGVGGRHGRQRAAEQVDGELRHPGDQRVHRGSQPTHRIGTERAPG